MNRIFPRLFGTTTQGSRPSAQARAAKKLGAESSSHVTGSVPLSTLNTGDRDVVVTEKPQDLESGFGAKITALPPMPAARQNRGDVIASNAKRGLQDLDEASNASTELIIQDSKQVEQGS
jgi:hypothetical protein